MTFSVSVDVPHKYQGNHKSVRYFLPKNKPNVDLTETSNYDHNSVHNDYNEEDDLPTWNLSTTNDVKNDETEDSIDPAKQPSSAAAKIETALPSPISSVPIFVTKYPILQVRNILLGYHQFM